MLAVVSNHGRETKEADIPSKMTKFCKGIIIHGSGNQKLRLCAGSRFSNGELVKVLNLVRCEGELVPHWRYGEEDVRELLGTVCFLSGCLKLGKTFFY